MGSQADLRRVECLDTNGPLPARRQTDTVLLKNGLKVTVMITITVITECYTVLRVNVVFCC